MPACATLAVETVYSSPQTLPAAQVRGYAWSGGGVPIVRVDVSTDGASWAVARVTGTEARVRHASTLQFLDMLGA